MSEISQFSQGLHEECGVFGMYDKTGATDMVSAVYSALYALQHRGQESCGIALNVDGVLSGYRDLGLVSEVFTKRVLEELPHGAKMATGHVRYATAGQRNAASKAIGAAKASGGRAWISLCNSARCGCSAGRGVWCMVGAGMWG